jgi:glycosyltransferase involved in cell wall biosynthesis
VSDATLFTIFTPTYNRAHTLHRVYDSLCAQTLRDFEWLVVDDGSTDNTAKLIADWVDAADFPIRYFRQEHLGKHIAHNLAAREARGKFFLPLDSDDACAPRALERMAYHWNAIPDRDLALYSGIDGLCSDQHGKIIGDRFPSEPFDTTLRERRYVYRIRGEKWGSTLTDVVRRYPFPSVARGQYLPEGIVWLDIGKTYKNRCVNEVFRTYYIDDIESGVTVELKRRLTAHAEGNWYYYLWLLNNDLYYFFHSPLPFVKAAIMVPVTAWTTKRGLGRILGSLQTIPAKALVVLSLPVSLLIFTLDGLRKPAR